MSLIFRSFRSLIAIILCLCVVTTLQLSSFAQATDTWLDVSKQPDITQGEPISKESYDDLLQSKRSFTAGLECTKKRIALRDPISRTSRFYKDGCWYNTNIGLLEREGQYLVEPDSGVAANIKGNARGTSHLMPTPDPDLFLELTEDSAAGGGYFMKFRPIDTIQFTRTIYRTGSVTLEYKVPAAAAFKSASGSIHVDNEDIWYSDNSKWMLVYTQRGTVYRINLETFSILSVHVRDKPSGLLKGMASISDDGRYIAFTPTDASYADLYIIDAQSCADEESPMAAPASKCAQRSLKAQLQAVMQPFSSVSLPNFYGESTLGIYHKNSAGISYDQYIIQAPNTQANSWNYVAMGDSFSSGEGAYDYEPGTDVADNKCHLSRKSYPYLISQEIDLVSFHSVACSGARIEHIFNSKQYEHSTKTLGKWHPGVLAQVSYFKADDRKPDIITITMSGNDIGFSNRIVACIFNPYCYSKYEQRKEIANEIEKHTKRLANTLTKIKDEAAPNVRIYMLGYPQIISSGPEAKCALNVWLNAQQRAMAHDLISYFNASIKAAAVKAGAVYVGIENSLSGHRLCEASGSQIAVNGITIGDDTGPLKLIGNESFHPNQLGNRLMKDAVLKQTDNLSKQPKAPQPNAEWPDAENYPFLKNAPRTSGEVYDLYHNPSNNPWYVAYPKHGIKIIVDAYETVLAANSSFKVILHSEPVELGHVKSDGAGSINVVLSLPEGIEPGVHTLHIVGPNEDGQIIDIYRHVYVGVSEDDFDGDGVLDEDEPCGVLEPAGVDEDQDGIDDGCDPIIGDTTIPEATPLPVESTNNMAPGNVQHAARLQHQSTVPVQAQTAVSHNTITHTNQSVLGENTIIAQAINASVSQVNSESEGRGTSASTQGNKLLSLFVAVGVIFTSLVVILYAKRNHGKER